MIESILEQVQTAVSRFVAKNPSLRNDRDDLVQDVFVKILPRMGGDFSLSQCRAFAHRATYWTCLTALRRRTENRNSLKNSPNFSELFVYQVDGDGLTGPLFVDWDRVEAIAEQHDALFTWFEIETDSDVRRTLQEQIEALFEPLLINAERYKLDHLNRCFR